MIVLGGVLAALLAGFLKGTIGFGFPTIGTPVLALFVDVKAAVAVLVPPNIVLDGLQARRGGAGLGTTLRRLLPLLLCGAAGMVLGTRLLIVLPPRVAGALLGGFLLVFVALTVGGVRLHVRKEWERWTGPPVGLLAGIIGGITNVPGTPLVLYFYALELPKAEFVRWVAISFLSYKAVQLVALVWYGAFTVDLIAPAAGVTAVALASFYAGQRIQDRLEQKVFNRVVLGSLAALGLALIARAAG
jgi:uncharacterized membrane protein YfcA